MISKINKEGKDWLQDCCKNWSWKRGLLIRVKIFKYKKLVIVFYTKSDKIIPLRAR
jgi:hypothetical protein